MVCSSPSGLQQVIISQVPHLAISIYLGGVCQISVNDLYFWALVLFLQDLPLSLHPSLAVLSSLVSSSLKYSYTVDGKLESREKKILLSHHTFPLKSAVNHSCSLTFPETLTFGILNPVDTHGFSTFCSFILSFEN